MANKKPAQTILEQVAVTKIAPCHYQADYLPQSMGNPLPIAYGGCSLGVATRAAYDTVPDTHFIYSVVGHYLGPASTLQPLTILVTCTRDTKTFATRRVELRQLQADGKTTRTCMEMLVDFHVDEPASAVGEFSPPPTREYTRWDKMTKDVQTYGDAKMGKAADKMFALNRRFFDSKLCPEGIAAQNLSGLLKDQSHSQDDVPMGQRTSAEWAKCLHDLSDSKEVSRRGDRAGAVSFFMDGGLSFLPLTHGHKWFDDISACSSLDFALRFMVPDIDMSREWHLRERSTISGAGGRTYSEGRLWDEKGQLVASMTQSSIMRKKPEPEEKGSKL